mgnify:CR=1 FL=1
MNVTNLIEKFKSYNETNKNQPTIEELIFLLENEDHEAFMIEYSLYSDIMDLRDHLEEE